jgi:hypothetical protein
MSILAFQMPEKVVMEKADDFKKMISDVVDVAFDEMEATPNDMAKIFFQLVWEEMASCIKSCMYKLSTIRKNL